MEWPLARLLSSTAMSDSRLRELERRWKETGLVEDEAAFLLERVRVGELTADDLKRAAYCGHLPSSTVTRFSVEPEQNLGCWAIAEGLDAPWWNRRCLAQAAASACALIVPPSGHENAFRQALHATQCWIAHPSSAHTEEARSLGESLEALRNGPWPALDAAIEAANACWSPSPHASVQNAVWCVVEVLSGVSVPNGAQTSDERRAWNESEARVRRRIQEDITALTLSGGLRDHEPPGRAHGGPSGALDR